MTKVYCLTIEDLLVIAEVAVGQEPLVCDYGLLESVAARPASNVFGAEHYRSIPEKAAALLHSIVCFHPLIDGNKRLGLLATFSFLDLNRVDFTATDKQAVEFVLSVASGKRRSVEEIAVIIDKYTVPRE